MSSRGDYRASVERYACKLRVAIPGTSRLKCNVQHGTTFKLDPSIGHASDEEIHFHGLWRKEGVVFFGDFSFLFFFFFFFFDAENG